MPSMFLSKIVKKTKTNLLSRNFTIKLPNLKQFSLKINFTFSFSSSNFPIFRFLLFLFFTFLNNTFFFFPFSLFFTPFLDKTMFLIFTNHTFLVFLQYNNHTSITSTTKRDVSTKSPITKITHPSSFLFPFQDTLLSPFSPNHPKEKTFFFRSILFDSSLFFPPSRPSSFPNNLPSPFLLLSSSLLMNTGICSRQIHWKTKFFFLSSSLVLNIVQFFFFEKKGKKAKRRG